jgi:hypothetical protein
MASRRAGESAPLGEREKPLVAGNRGGASGWVWLRLGQRLGPQELPSEGRVGSLVAPRTSLLADEPGTGADVLLQNVRPVSGALPSRHPRAARYLAEHGRWPNASRMASRFGSLRGAVEAAKVAGTLKRR